MITFYF